MPQHWQLHILCLGEVPPGVWVDCVSSENSVCVLTGVWDNMRLYAGASIGPSAITHSSVSISYLFRMAGFPIMYAALGEMTSRLLQVSAQADPGGPSGPGPPCPQDLFKIMQAILRENPYFLANFGLRAPLVSKLHQPPLTKILDPPLKCLFRIKAAMGLPSSKQALVKIRTQVLLQVASESVQEFFHQLPEGRVRSGTD